VPVTAYEEAMSYYARSIAVLEGQSGPQVAAVIANTYELQGQTAVVCGRPIEAAGALEQAARIYSELRMDMQAAVAHTLAGLLYYDQGKRGLDLYTRAAESYQAALAYFREARMLDMQWKVLYYLALASFHQGRLALTATEQEERWHAAAQYLQDAGAAIEFVRGQFIEAHEGGTQSARLALVSDKEQVYMAAIQLYYQYLKDTQQAFNWLERLKGRAFLDALALTSFHASASTDETLVASEVRLLDALQHAITQTRVVELNEQLHTLWNGMATDPAAREYIALRRGEPVNWKELGPLLK